MTCDSWSIGRLIVVVLFVIGTDRTSADVIYFDIPSIGQYLVPCKNDSSKGLLKSVHWIVKGPVVAQYIASEPPSNCSRKYCFDFSTPYALRVSNVSVNDSGEYRCTFWYQDADYPMELVTDVVVRVAPAVPNMVPSSLNFLEGTSFVLTCNSAGNPPPNITWFKGGLVLQNNVTSTANASGEVVGSILFSPSSADDGAFLTCAAGNGAGIKNTTVLLNVSYEPKNITVGPSRMVTAIEETDVALNCSAKGNPIPLLVWKYANTDGARSLLSGIGEVSYVVRKVRRQDAGTYVCIVSNLHGNSSATLTLGVNYKPSKPVVRSNSSIYSSGNNITLLCVTDDEGNPPAWYNWTKDGAWIRGMLPNNVLSQPFAAVSASGSYSCIASNKAGWRMSDNFNLSVHGDKDKSPLLNSASSSVYSKEALFYALLEAFTASIWPKIY